MTLNLQSFLSNQIALQRKSLFLWSPVMMGAGIVGYFTFDMDLPWAVIISALFFIVLVLWKSIWAYSQTGQVRWFWCILLSIVMGLMVAGFSFAQGRTQSLATPLLEKDTSKTIEATIEKLVYLDGGKAKRVILRDKNNNMRYRLKTYHFKGDEWRIGDRVQVLARLRSPSGPVMPGGFDFRFKAYYEELSAIGYTMGDAQLLERSNTGANIIQTFRDAIGKRLYNVMDAQYAGIAQALLTGERAGIAKDDTEALRSSGLAHLLAI